MSGWHPIETAPKDGTPIAVRGDGWPTTAVWVAEPHRTFGWVFADPEGKPIEVERQGNLTYLTIDDEVTQWKPLSRKAAGVTMGADLRDFFEKPITVEEMAAAIERAHREVLARTGVADFQVVCLQEASKALRRGGHVHEVAVQAARAASAARIKLDDAVEGLQAVLRSKPPGREL